MREIRPSTTQEYDDENDELISLPETEASTDISQVDEKAHWENVLDSDEAKDLEKEQSPERITLLQELEELLAELDRDAQERTAEAADLAESSEGLVNEQLAGLEDSEAEPIRIELESAKNELLGRTSDAYDDWEARRAEIAEENQIRSDELREKFGQEKAKPIEGIVKLSAVERGEKSEPVSQESELDRLFRELEKGGASEIDEMERGEEPPLDPEMVAVVPEPLNLDFEDDTSVEVENPSESGAKTEINLRSPKNVGVFNRLTTGAKQIWVDLNFKRKGESEINRGQKMLEKSEDKIHGLKADLMKSDDKIDELQDKLTNIDEMMGKLGTDMKIKEKVAIEKSRRDLERKIQDEENKKDSLSRKLEAEETSRIKLQEGIEAAMEKLNQALDKRIEPYKQEVEKLETNRGNLVEEKENFEAVVSDFENRLASLNDQLADLDSMGIPTSAKKSFKAVLNRKIKDIEAALKVSYKNISKLEDNIVRVNGRLNKEELKIGKWEGVRDYLKETADKKVEKEREAISRSYMPRERIESPEEDQEAPEFSPEDYIDKWNSFSKNDGMLLDKEWILSSKGELTLKRLEGIIKTTRFRGLSERQLKKKIKEKIDLLRAHFGIY